MWVLGNHDVPRLRTRYGGDRGSARVSAAVVLLTLRGTPFLYAGDELGLLDAEVPADRIVDPGLRDGCRAPLPWTAEDGHGWLAEPWLPWPPEAADRAVVAQRADEDSILWLHRRLLRARRASAALRGGHVGQGLRTRRRAGLRARSTATTCGGWWPTSRRDR